MPLKIPKNVYKAFFFVFFLPLSGQILANRWHTVQYMWQKHFNMDFDFMGTSSSEMIEVLQIRLTLPQGNWLRKKGWWSESCSKVHEWLQNEKILINVKVKWGNQVLGAWQYIIWISSHKVSIPLVTSGRFLFFCLSGELKCASCLV